MFNAALLAGNAVKGSGLYLENHDGCALVCFLVGAALLAIAAYALCQRPGHECARYLHRH